MGFGSFSVKEKAARLGRNPRTGEKINIPAKTSVIFKPSKKLSEAVNGKAETQAKPGPAPKAKPAAKKAKK
jgi:DNA-binding protein HU-beta